MLKFRILTIFVLLFSLAVTSYATPTEIGACEGVECMKVAQTSEWPVGPEKSAMKISINGLSLALPHSPERIIRQGNGDLAMYIGKSYLDLGVLNSYVETNPENVELPEGITFTVADAAKLPFTKTIKDTPPENAADRWVWDRAMLLKEQHFANKAKVFTAKKGHLTVFIVESSIGSYYAYIVDDLHRDSYTYIGTGRTGWTAEKFKQVVGSVIAE